MADSSWMDAVPIGLLMFAGTVFGVLRRQWGKRASRGAFPELATKLGLEYVAPETPGAAGVLKGSQQGFYVRVESEVRARIVVRLNTELPLDLRNYDRWTRLPPGMNPFAFADRGLNAWLRTRLVSEALLAAVARDARLPPLLLAVRTNPALREFTLADSRIECVFDFGARALFPVPAAENALRQALALAAELDALRPVS